MRLFHLLSAFWEQNKTGVPRFGKEFKKAFPETIEIRPIDVDQKSYSEFRDDDVVVTDNHLALLLPDRVRKIVVHHGSAMYHYKVDPAWRSPQTKKMADDQREVIRRGLELESRTRFVAPSVWVGTQFGPSPEIGIMNPRTRLIPHYVGGWEERGGGIRLGSTVIGDWRNFNKGSEAVARLSKILGQFEFVKLDFEAEDFRKKADLYGRADAYLCLSLSEGAPYSVADAEVFGIPIVSTFTGNVYEFEPYVVKNRDDVDEVERALIAATRDRRRRVKTFYSDYRFEKWVSLWRDVIKEVAEA